MNIEELARRIFCAMLSDSGKITLYPEPGQQQIRMAFELARVFQKVSQERLETVTNAVS